MDKQKYIADLLIREGGEKYTNRPADRGGPTRWGVTEAKAREFGYTGSMRDFPLDYAVRIYDLCFWRGQMIDEIADYSEDLAICMFDFGVNSGTVRAGKMLQTLLNVLNNRGQIYDDIAVDGWIGWSTLGALSNYYSRRGNEGLVVLVRALNAMRIAFCVSLSASDETQEANTYGWLRRVVELID